MRPRHFTYFWKYLIDAMLMVLWVNVSHSVNDECHVIAKVVGTPSRRFNPNARGDASQNDLRYAAVA